MNDAKQTILNALTGKVSSNEAAHQALGLSTVHEDIPLMPDESIDDFEDSLRGAVRAKFMPADVTNDGHEVYIWVRDAFDDHAVVCFDGGAYAGKMYEVPYTRDADGAFEVGDLGAEVQQRTIYVPVGEQKSSTVEVLTSQDEESAIKAREMRSRLSALQRNRSMLPVEREAEMTTLRDTMRASLRFVLPPELHATVDSYDDEGLMREFWAAFEVPHPKRVQTYET